MARKRQIRALGGRLRTSVLCPRLDSRTLASDPRPPSLDPQPPMLIHSASALALQSSVILL